MIFISHVFRTQDHLPEFRSVLQRAVSGLNETGEIPNTRRTLELLVTLMDASDLQSQIDTEILAKYAEGVTVITIRLETLENQPSGSESSFLYNIRLMCMNV